MVYTVQSREPCRARYPMDSVIYLVGLVVVVMFVLSVLGLR
jgi:hypothetical protein